MRSCDGGSVAADCLLLRLATLLAPLVALAGPFGDQLRTFGVFGYRYLLVVPTLIITLPLALWLGVS